MSVRVSIQPMHPRFDDLGLLPRRMSQHAAGFDVRAALDEPVILGPGEWTLVPCGFAMAIPEGYECQVRPRSGLAAKHGVTLLNSPGTIDADYRGEVKVIVINHGQGSFAVQPGERLAQLVFAAVAAPALDVTVTLPESGRGGGGFGSTGRG